MLNLIKKLEQKENIISKLNYKIEKYEKQLELINTYNNIEQNLKNKNNNNINGTLKKTISEDSIVNDNGYLLSIRKDSARSHNKTKSEENSIPLEKFNSLLEKLNQTEERFAKLQKDNIELKKYEKLYLNQNNNNPINMVSNGNIQENKKDEIINNNILNTNDLNQSNKTEESDYYKNKYNELEMKLKILKEACKNILIRLTIPKKDREEIKQILKIFEFTDEETAIIIGEKKNNK